MNAQRTFAFALVVLQAAALAVGFRTTVFSAVMVGIGLVGWLSSFRLASAEKARRWAIWLVVLYAVLRTVLPPEFRSGFVLSDSRLLAMTLLAFQVGQFFIAWEDKRLPGYLPFLAIVGFAFSGDFQANGRERLIYQVLSVGLIVLTASYFAACRVYGSQRPARRLVGHSIFLGMTLVVSGALGWVAASNLYRYAHDIEAMLVSALNPPPQADSAGFSGKGRLGSVASQKAGSGKRVALRVYAEDAPGYLRGRAFDTYTEGEWQTEGQWATVSPDGRSRLQKLTPAGRDDLLTFSVLRSEVDMGRRLEIWPNEMFQDALFVPEGLVGLQAPVDTVSVDRYGIVKSEELPPYTAYTALTSEDPAAAAGEYRRPIPSVDWELLTTVPEDLDPRIRALATRVVGEATTTQEKIAAVEGYFLNNYDYQVGIDIPAGVDPLTYFLVEKPAAHCEFFASGAVVLLRAAGVPSRYVTGFVASERNKYGDYWLARNRDAHAWAESFDPERGWVVVEATPASGVPQAVSVAVASQLWDALRARWQRFVAAIQRDGMRAVLGVLVRWLLRPWLIAVLLLVGTGIVVRRFWHRRNRQPARPRDPQLERLQTLLREMDRRWRKAGLERRPEETFHQFAERLTSDASDPVYQQAADWYRLFAATRFSGRVDAASVEMLEEALKEHWGGSSRGRFSPLPPC